MQPDHSRLPAAFWVPISTLEKWRKNPRKNASAVPGVARSIRKFGFTAPVIVWESRARLVAGHTRLLAMEQLLVEDPHFVPRDAPGVGLVPVRFCEFTDEAEAAAYAIADNKLNEAAEWDEGLLAEVMREIGESDQRLLAETGFGGDEIDRLIRETGGEDTTGGDPGDGRYQSQYGVIVICAGEAEQRKIYEQLKGEGFNCKVVVV